MHRFLRLAASAAIAVLLLTDTCNAWGASKRHGDTALQRPYIEFPESDTLKHINPDPQIADFYRRFPPAYDFPNVFFGFRPWRRPDLKLHRISYGELSEPIAVVAPGPRDWFEYITDDNTDFSLPTPTQKEQCDVALLTDPRRAVPSWLRVASDARAITADLSYRYITTHPEKVDYIYAMLPEPPRLPEDDHSVSAYLQRLVLPPVDPSKAELPVFTHTRRYWLHNFNVGLQFSQAYISSNWYQGGNDYLQFLFNFNWNVELNTVFHPRLMFQSALSYKLGVNSNPKESVHPYSVSQDIFQYNVKAGIKAWHSWFYSLTLQFKTQLFNSYPADSENRSAAFLSPGSLTVGLGMTWNRENTGKTFKLSLSISPLSYNLKTCTARDIDHVQYNIRPWRKTASEIGSNAETNMEWKIADNIFWKSRLFLFTDYKYFLADWENTLTFAINRFLSTQIYLHPRFDSSSDKFASKWRYWMFKEILSFGLSFNFSTKP